MKDLTEAATRNVDTVGNPWELRLLELEDRLWLLPIPEFEGVAFIAKKLGVSESYLRQRRYLLPQWGVTSVPGKLLWSFPELREWLKVTPADRKKQWDSMPNTARRVIIGKWTS